MEGRFTRVRAAGSPEFSEGGNPMSWKRAVLNIDGGAVEDPKGVIGFVKDVRSHWGFYLISSAFTAAVCTMAVKLLAS